MLRVYRRTARWLAGHAEDVRSGKVRARYDSSVGFRVSGRIAQRPVEVVTRVHRNQPLAKLRPFDAVV